MSAHDRWLADYRKGTAEVWCTNPACQLHEDGTTVTYESEYGQGWYTPEECKCGHEWTEDKPDEEEDDDDA